MYGSLACSFTSFDRRVVSHRVLPGRCALRQHSPATCTIHEWSPCPFDKKKIFRAAPKHPRFPDPSKVLGGPSVPKTNLRSQRKLPPLTNHGSFADRSG